MRAARSSPGEFWSRSLSFDISTIRKEYAGARPNSVSHFDMVHGFVRSSSTCLSLSEKRGPVIRLISHRQPAG